MQLDWEFRLKRALKNKNIKLRKNKKATISKINKNLRFLQNLFREIWNQAKILWLIASRIFHQFYKNILIMDLSFRSLLQASPVKSLAAKAFLSTNKILLTKMPEDGSTSPKYIQIINCSKLLNLSSRETKQEKD